MTLFKELETVNVFSGFEVIKNAENAFRYIIVTQSGILLFQLINQKIEELRLLEVFKLH